MKRKIFININLSDQTKKRLIKATNEWRVLPVKWTKEPNFHITLEFLGFVPDDDIPQICQNIQEVSQKTEIFELYFDRIELTPKDDPKTIWLSGEASEELKVLQENIQKSLGIYVSSKKVFCPHITLGRIRKHKWLELEKTPKIEKEYPLIISVESVDVMASDFENEGIEYTTIESCLLK